MLGEKRTAVWWAAASISCRWASECPVVATTIGILRSSHVFTDGHRPGSGMEKSITHVRLRVERQVGGDRERRSGRRRRPPRRRAPGAGASAQSIAATTWSSVSSWARATSRWPIRPQAPLMAMRVFMALAPLVALESLDERGVFGRGEASVSAASTRSMSSRQQRGAGRATGRGKRRSGGSRRAMSISSNMPARLTNHSMTASYTRQRMYSPGRRSTRRRRFFAFASRLDAARRRPRRRVPGSRRDTRRRRSAPARPLRGLDQTTGCPAAGSFSDIEFQRAVVTATHAGRLVVGTGTASR